MDLTVQLPDKPSTTDMFHNTRFQKELKGADDVKGIKAENN